MTISPYPTDEQLAELRSIAEVGMIDTCSITRVDPDAAPGPIDPDTMQYPPLARITIYSGKCRFQAAGIANAASSVANTGERDWAIQGAEIQLPADGTATVSVDDVVEILTSPIDSTRVGRMYTVSTRFDKTHAVSRRLRLSEVTG